MKIKYILCFFMVIFLVAINGLKLNHRKPSTIWGVQTQAFRQKEEKQFFSSYDGTYHFKYDSGFNRHQSFRHEKRYQNGTVTGFFGYIDPKGVLRITEYIADHLGYRQRTVLRYLVIDEYFSN